MIHVCSHLIFIAYCKYCFFSSIFSFFLFIQCHHWRDSYSSIHFIFCFSGVSAELQKSLVFINLNKCMKAGDWLGPAKNVHLFETFLKSAFQDCARKYQLNSSRVWSWNITYTFCFMRFWIYAVLCTISHVCLYKQTFWRILSTCDINNWFLK